MVHVGREIRRVREERGLNQTQLAASVGTGPAAISRIENGRQSPNMETLEKIARALELEMSDLFPKAEAPLFQHEQVVEPRRPDVVPALPEVVEWTRGLGPEAELIAMSDDEFYDHAESVIGGDPFKVKPLLDRLERGRDAIETALKGQTQGMPEALRPNEPASGPEDRVYAAVRRRQPRRRAGQWARARAHVRARNLFAYVLERTAAMPSEAQVEQLIEETAEKQA